MATTEIKKEIRTILVENPNVDRKKLAIEFNVTNKEVGAVLASINKLNNQTKKADISKVNINEGVDSVIDNVIDKCTDFLDKTVIENENTFANEDGVKKDIARNKIVNYVEVEGFNLTLPNKHPIIEERMLNKLTKSTFLGVECHAPTYNDLVKIVEAKALPMETKLGYIENFVYCKKANSYANLIYDFCSGLHKIHDLIEYTVDNDIMGKDGIMAITCARMIRRSNDPFVTYFNSLGDYKTNDNRKRIDKKFEHYFNRILNPLKYKLVELHPYKDKGRHAMMLIIIKRIA